MARLKFIRQEDIKDCGPICMAMISRYYGLSVSIEKLRVYGGTDLQGTNIKGLMAIGEQLGFDVKGVRAESQDTLREIPLPAIAHVVTENGFSHFLIIEKVKEDKITVIDPAKGRQSKTIEEFCQRWTGVLVLIKPNSHFNKGKIDASLWPIFASLFKSNKSLITSLFFSSLILNIFGFLGTFYFKFLVDDIIPNELLNSLHIISLGVLLLYVIQVILNYFRSHLLLYFSMRTDITLMLGYYKHVINLPLSFFETRKTGEIISRFMDAGKIRDAFSTTLVTLMIDILMISIGTILLYLHSPKLFTITLLFLPIYVLLAFIFKNPYEKLNREEMENSAKVNSYLIESLSGIPIIKSYNAEKDVFHKTETYFIRLLKKIFVLGVYTNIQTSLKGLLDFSTGLTILWVGSKYVIEGTMTLGELLTFNALVVYFLGPIERLLGLQPIIQSAIVATKRLGEVFQLESEKDLTDHQKIKFSFFNKELKFENVSFRYGTRKNVLNQISFNVPKGQHVAFVGESGSGKTTIAKVLMNFYDPLSGNIIFDDYNLKEISKTSLRDGISYVSQDTFLFSGTILENLMFGLENIVDLKEVIEACKKACAHEFIEELPMRYESPIEENGGNLSGGQKQRLAIAKAILKKSDLIILDEATSALDSTTEQNIIKELRLLKEDGVTLVMIAHRLSTIQHADQIFVMKKGEILESGMHTNLIHQSGEYYRLWENQKINV